ncbi:ferredoxin [archaeon]|nr:ferredoxin [archaeon]
MATLQTEDGQEKEFQDGGSTQPAAEELGTPFGCKHGMCGTCRVEVLEGMEKLGERNDQEKAMGLEDSNFRLMCQCSIKEGTVKIRI